MHQADELLRNAAGAVMEDQAMAALTVTLLSSAAEDCARQPVTACAGVQNANAPPYSSSW